MDNDKKIEKGVEVLCIHDNHDKMIGDKAIVYGFDAICGCMILQGSQYHYKKEDFVAFSEGPIVHVDPNMIHISKVIHLIEDITKAVIFNQSQGVVPVEAVINKIKYNIEALDLKRAYFTPGNKINENE